MSLESWTIQSDSAQIVRIMRENETVAAVYPCDGPQCQMRRARLMCAAPRLLAMLEQARDQLANLNQNENDGGRFLAQIDATIKSALGENK